MKTIQMTIEEDLLAEIDQVIGKQGTSRSAFIRSALRSALRKEAIREKERQHARGYAEKPVAPGEFDVWGPEQAWEKE